MFSRMYNHEEIALLQEQAGIEEMEYWYAVRQAEYEAARDYFDNQKYFWR